MTAPIIVITCNTYNTSRPIFNAIVDGVFLESENLSKMEGLIRNVYRDVKYQYEFDRKMKWVRHVRVVDGDVEAFSKMQFLDTDYVQQFSGIFESYPKSNGIRVYDIHGDTLATMTRDEYAAGKYPTL